MLSERLSENMAIMGVYFFNLLCAIVPCQLSQPPPEAYISEATNEVSLDENLTYVIGPEPSEIRQKRLLWNPREESNIRFSFMDNPLSPSNILSKMTSIFSRRAPRSENLDGSSYSGPIVFTRTGPVEGYYMGTMKGRKLKVFEGIPYAEPPLGNLRFQLPVKHKKWANVFQAKKPGSECLQGHPIKLFRVTGSENCLYLNVYTPELPKNEKSNPNFPVIFFIHGGSFWYGSGTEYGPSYLLDNDVVLVTFNYRLGALGFLSNGDDVLPGNFGLKDQYLALEWVHENIESFGGDKNRITIMGQSAGGVSANIHLISRNYPKLFSSGVSLSGSAFGHWPIVPRKRAKKFASKLGRKFGCSSSTSEKLLSCLSSISASWIIAAQQQLFEWIVPFHPLVVFAPVIENNNPSAILTMTPEEAYNRSLVPRIPWIFGQTSQEGHFETYMIRAFLQSTIVSLRPTSYLPIILDYNYNNESPRLNQITDSILRFYNPNDEIVTLPMISEMYTDRIFSTILRKAIRHHGRIAPTYCYIFNYLGKYNLGPLFGVRTADWGVSHTEDLFYYFNSSVFHHGLQKKDAEYQLSTIMTNVLAHFAKTGRPLLEHDGKIIEFWSPATVSDKPLRCLEYSKDVKMIDDPFDDRVKFWNSLGLKDYEEKT